MNDDTRPTGVCIILFGFYPEDHNVQREVEVLRTEGLDVSVLCLRGENKAGTQVEDGASIHRLPIGVKGDGLWMYLFNTKLFCVLAIYKLMMKRLRGSLRVIEICNPPDSLALIALCFRPLGVKVVQNLRRPAPEYFATRHSDWYYWPIAALLRLTEELSLKIAHRAVVANREMRDNLGENGADVNKITVIVDAGGDGGNGAGDQAALIDQTAKARRDERRRGDFSVVSHLAIDEDSGVDLVIESVARLKERLPGLTYRVIVVSGPIEKLADLAERLKIADRIHFLTNAGPEEIRREIVTANVGIVSVRQNPYTSLLHPRAIYDYIALGKPVIAPRLRALAAYFPEDSILYFQPGDVDDLAEKIYSFFAYPEESSPRIKNAGDVYNAHRWERESRKYVGVYRQLLSKRPWEPKTAR